MAITLDVSQPGVGDLLADFECLGVWNAMHADSRAWTAVRLSQATGLATQLVEGCLRRLESLGLCRRARSGRPEESHAFRAMPGPLVVTFDPGDRSSELRIATARLGLMGHLHRVVTGGASLAADGVAREMLATVGLDADGANRLRRELDRLRCTVQAATGRNGGTPAACVSLSVRPLAPQGLRLPMVLLMPAAEAPSRRSPAARDLSPREREIAEALVEGLTKREIADRLGVSFSTVNTITSRIYRKLGVSRRAALVNAMRA